MIADDMSCNLVLSFPNNDNIADITNDRIYAESLTIEESLIDSDVLQFGKCNVSRLSITVADFDTDITGMQMNVSLTVYNETESNIIPLGKWIVQSCDRTSDKMRRTIVAYDFMEKLNVDVTEWFNTVLFPTVSTENDLGWKAEIDGITIDVSYLKDVAPEPTENEDDNGLYYLNNSDGYLYIGVANYNEDYDYINTTWDFVQQCEKNIVTITTCNVDRSLNQIIDMLFSYLGIDYDDFNLVNGDFICSRTFNPNGLKGTDLLQFVCELNGVFGHFDFTGKFQFISLNDDTQKQVSIYKSCDYDEAEIISLDAFEASPKDFPTDSAIVSA